jgi:hypothetical protein
LASIGWAGIWILDAAAIDVEARDIWLDDRAATCTEAQRKKTQLKKSSKQAMIGESHRDSVSAEVIAKHRTRPRPYMRSRTGRFRLSWVDSTRHATQRDTRIA